MQLYTHTLGGADRYVNHLLSVVSNPAAALPTPTIADDAAANGNGVVGVGGDGDGAMDAASLQTWAVEQLSAMCKNAMLNGSAWVDNILTFLLFHGYFESHVIIGDGGGGDGDDENAKGKKGKKTKTKAKKGGDKAAALNPAWPALKLPPRVKSACRSHLFALLADLSKLKMVTPADADGAAAADAYPNQVGEA
jgi:hypothetical protein